MEFRIARKEDLERMCEITAQAKAGLKKMGLDQWQNGYPSREIWESDILNQCTYVAVEDGMILGVFAFETIPDVSYFEIDGAWKTKGPSAAMHRVCVADEAKGKGVAGKMFAHGFHMAKTLGFVSLRIDTHPGNLPMQRALGKAGFEQCGYIHLAKGSEKGALRIGFEKIL
ncbi:MAG: GNAT family N-acetyltransferase [Lachnospiraceae bacterium]|nr:GNAT family N-acetyltransferase [Lachnospiraceae bacterium]